MIPKQFQNPVLIVLKELHANINGVLRSTWNCYESPKMQITWQIKKIIIWNYMSKSLDHHTINMFRPVRWNILGLFSSNIHLITCMVYGNNYMRSKCTLTDRNTWTWVLDIMIIIYQHTIKWVSNTPIGNALAFLGQNILHIALSSWYFLHFKERNGFLLFISRNSLFSLNCKTGLDYYCHLHLQTRRSFVFAVHGGQHWPKGLWLDSLFESNSCKRLFIWFR